MASPFVVTPNGNGEATASFTDTITASNAFTVGHAGDWITAVVATDDVNAVVSVTAGIISFKKIADLFASDLDTVTASVWIGLAPVGFSGISIVATTAVNFDDCSLIWWITRGANIAKPLDPNVSLPAIVTGSPPSSPVVFNTSFPDDLLFFIFAGHTGDSWLQPPPPYVTPAAWQYLQSSGNSGGFGFVAATVYQQSVSATQNNATADTIATLPSSAVLCVIAFTADSAPVGNGQSIVISLPPPITSPCVQPCAVELNPNSHAFDMFYGTPPLPTMPFVPEGPSSFVLSNGITLEV